MHEEWRERERDNKSNFCTILSPSSNRIMLEAGASVNFYMFFGGTNFGFTAGATKAGIGDYVVEITSYDYDAPMDEAGDVTPKYHVLRDVIKDFLPLPNITVPVKAPKMELPPIQLRPKTTLLSQTSRKILGSKMVTSPKPLKFEEINQFSGFVLYEALLPDHMLDPSVLKVCLQVSTNGWIVSGHSK